MREEFLIQSNDGKTDLHGFVWRPEGEVKAVLQLVHGMVEHIARYEAFATFLTTKGFAVIGNDLLGHGQSVTGPDKLGFFAEKDGATILIEDIQKIRLEGEKLFPGKPLFLLGHSMGSFLVRKYITKYSKGLAGAVVMGTGYIPAPLAGVGHFLASTIAAFRGPMYHSNLVTGLALGNNNKPFAPNRTPFDWLSVDEENIDRYMADPLCGYQFTVSAYKDFFSFIGDVGKKKDFDRIEKTLPVFIISGELDPVGGKAACPKVEKELKDLQFADVTLKLYSNMRHEILNEIDREAVFEDILRWMENRI